jgi:uncharacterized membrane protein YhiD involved in acid resistance
MTILSEIADITGIISFIITVILIFLSNDIRKEISRQRRDYQNEQESIKNILMALRENIWSDNLLDIKIKSQIRTQLYSFQQKFKKLLSKNDKQHIRVTLIILDKDVEDISRDILCKELDYFIARFDKKEN